MKDYILMNKNTPLLEMQMEDGDIIKVGKVFNFELLPLYFRIDNKGVSRRVLSNWWRKRQIPTSRSGLKHLIWEINPTSGDNPIPEMTEKMLGFSLSDQYWIYPIGTDLTWDECNFFTNEFSEDIGNLLVGQNIQGNVDIESPDNTSDGVIKKRWKIINGKRCLLKGYSSIDRKPEPFRELLASHYLSILLPNNYVPYTVIRGDNDEVYSCCENFITTDTEYINFVQVVEGIKKRNEVSFYNFIKTFYSGYEYVLDLMLILDFIVANTDRHYGNFGLIRNVNTGELLGPAPVFDTGNSLYHDTNKISFFNVDSKPFHKSWDKQIKCVDVKDYVEDIEKLKSVHDELFLSAFLNSPEPEERKIRYLSSISARIDYLLNECKNKSVESLEW